MKTIQIATLVIAASLAAGLLSSCNWTDKVVEMNTGVPAAQTLNSGDIEIPREPNETTVQTLNTETNGSED